MSQNIPGPSLSGATRGLPLRGDRTRERPSRGPVEKIDVKCTPAEETAAPISRIVTNPNNGWPISYWSCANHDDCDLPSGHDNPDPLMDGYSEPTV